MPGKPIPSWPSDKPFDGLPTLDALLQQSGLKVTRLRLLLRGVSRWKCKDNTVRYDPIAAAAALEEWEDDDGPANDNDDGPANDNAREPPLPADPTLAALALYQRSTQQVLTTMQRTLSAQNDVIKQMAEPLKLGMELVKEAQDVLRARLGKYDKQWDRMILITEELQSTQAERDQASERAAHRIAMQKRAFDTVDKYIPDVLSKFALTREASYALDLAYAIDPAHWEVFLALDGLLTPEKREMAQQLLEMLKARRKQQEGKSDAKPQEPATATAAEPTAAAPGDPAASASEVRNDTAATANGAAAH